MTAPRCLLPFVGGLRGGSGVDGVGLRVVKVSRLPQEVAAAFVIHGVLVFVHAFPIQAHLKHSVGYNFVILNLLKIKLLPNVLQWIRQFRISRSHKKPTFPFTGNRILHLTLLAKFEIVSVVPVHLRTATPQPLVGRRRSSPSRRQSRTAVSIRGRP